MAFDENSLEVSFRRLSPISCEIVVRWRSTEGDVSISGTVRGPESVKSRMLPATFRLRGAASKDEEVCAVATIPDPCFWSPTLPAFYRVSIDLLRDGDRLAHIKRSLGIRPLDIRGTSFYWDSRRWVPRAVSYESLTRLEWDAFRDTGAALFVREPDDDFCRRASEEGVMLLARIQGDDDELRALSRRLSQWAAVAFVLIEGESVISQELLDAAPNLIFIRQAGAVDSASPRTAAAVEIQTGNSSHPLPSQFAGPLIAVRRLASPTDAASARAACDRLQRDLAPAGDWAGYVV